MHREQKMRLDVLILMRGLVPSRARARDLIKRGLVNVEGKPVTKPAATVAGDVSIEVCETEAAFVSRGAAKLTAALETFGFDPAGRAVLDVGASTGGFTQVLLAKGARRVYAVDVGHGQLDPVLRDDPRVVNLEGRDARTLTSVDLPEPIGAITADVSFISLTKVLPAVLSFAIPGAWLVALVKPQFEAGPNAIGKGGIVRDEAARERAVANLLALMERQPGWRTLKPVPSPILGGDGNREFLLGAKLMAGC